MCSSPRCCSLRWRAARASRLSCVGRLPVMRSAIGLDHISHSSSCRDVLVFRPLDQQRLRPPSAPFLFLRPSTLRHMPVFGPPWLHIEQDHRHPTLTNSRRLRAHDTRRARRLFEPDRFTTPSADSEPRTAGDRAHALLGPPQSVTSIGVPMYRAHGAGAVVHAFRRRGTPGPLFVRGCHPPQHPRFVGSCLTPRRIVMRRRLSFLSSAQSFADGVLRGFGVDDRLDRAV